jgi:hypothetical protein
MSKLSKLYEAQQTLKENGLSFSEEQEAQLRALEEDIIKNDILPVLTEQIEPALKQVQRELVLVVDYVPGEDLKVHLSRKRNITDVLTDAIEISPKRTVIRTKPIELRSESVGFTVKFDDGTVISNSNAKKTFVGALQHMGLPRVSSFKGRTFADFPLVGHRHRVTEDGYKWQEEVDGWWIYVNMSNDTKMSMLYQVSQFLGIPLTIEVNGERVNNKPQSKEHNARRMFSLNGGTPLNKRSAVFAAIERYQFDNPEASFNDIESVFPRDIQGSYGVVATAEEVYNRRAQGQDVDKRYFTNKPLHDGNGKTFYVCNQWGDENFEAFRCRIAEELNWTLTEV